MKIPQKLIDWAVFGNLWISACGAACLWLGQWLGTPASAELLLLLFFATSFRYNLIGFTVSKGANSEKFLFAWKHRQSLQIIALVSATASLTLAFQILNLQQWMLLLHFAFLSLWYVFPIPKIAPPLRKLPYIKIFLIAYVWAGSTWLLPLLAQKPLLHLEPNDYLVFAERMLFLFSITLPFDIRDINADREDGVKTIPRSIGTGATKALGTLTLGVATIMHFTLHPEPTAIGLSLGNAFALALLWATRQRYGDHYFLGAVDGAMIVQAVMVFLFN